MPAFSITPQGGWPAPAAETPPRFMQIQGAGVDLGTPTVDTLNFGDGLTATRGTGESANTVTVTAEGGGGGGGETFAGTLTTTENPFSPGSIGHDGLIMTVTELAAASFATVSNGELTISQNGYYEFVIQGRMAYDTSSGGAWTNNSCIYGSVLGIDGLVSEPTRSAYERSGQSSASDYQPEVQWSDTAVVAVTSGQVIDIRLYLDKYITENPQFSASGQVVIRRLADYTPGG